MLVPLYPLLCIFFISQNSMNLWLLFVFSFLIGHAAPKSVDVTRMPSFNFATLPLWMFNSSLQFLRRKLNAHCVWRQSIIPRLCRAFTHSASSVLTNTHIFQEDSYQRQSNVRFVRHLFKFPKATRSRTCPHIIISTDWWMFSL